MSVAMTFMVSGPMGGVWAAVPVWNFIPVTLTYSPGGGNFAAHTDHLCQFITVVFRAIITYVKCYFV